MGSGLLRLLHRTHPGHG